MWFWNRIEVYNGYSIKEFNELRDVLLARGITHSYRLVKRSSKGRTGFLGQNPELNTRYYLYVHKKDYDNAMFHLHNSRF